MNKQSREILAKLRESLEAIPPDKLAYIIGYIEGMADLARAGGGNNGNQTRD